MQSDDEEAEFALDIRKLYAVAVPACSMGQKEPLKSVLQSKREKDPTLTVCHYDHDRRRLYYGMDNGAVCFWPIAQQACNTSRFVGAHKGPVTAIATPRKEDGELGRAGLLVSGSVDSSIKVWDYQGKVILEPAVCVQTLYGHSGTVTALVILGDYLLSSSTDSTIRVWRQEEGRGQLVYPWLELQTTVTAVEGWVRCMTYGSSGDQGDLGAIYAADESGGIIKVVPEALWDDSIQRLSTKMEFKVTDRVAKIHDRAVSFIKYIAKWDLVLSVAYDQCLRTYDTKTNTMRHCWENENHCQFTALEVELEFDEVLACDTSGMLSIYSVRTGRLMASKRLVPQGAKPSASSTTTQPHNILAITQVLGRQLYAVLTGREFALWHIEHELEFNIARGGHEKAVIGLYSCSGGVAGSGGEHDYRVFSASVDNTVRLWDPYDMACIRVLEESSSEISALTYYEGWNMVVTGHDNGDIRLWNLDTSSTTTLKQHSNTVTALTLALIHRNEELLISTGYDGWVVLWDIRSLRGEPPHMVAKFRAHGPEAVRSLTRADGADGNDPLTATGSVSGMAPGSVSGMAPGTEALGAAAAAGSETAGTSRSSGPADTLHRMLTGSGAEPEILALRFDPMKKAIITAGNDKVIRVWSASGYAYMGCHIGHKEAVTCLTLDSNFLFSGSDDRIICLWDTVPSMPTKPAFPGVRASVGAPQPPPAMAIKGHFTGRPLKVLQGHTKTVTGLEVLPRSGALVSCSLDGSVLIWDYVTGAVTHRYTNDVEAFRCLAVRHDRAEVLVGTMQANILRYAVQEPNAPPAAAGPSMATHGGTGTGMSSSFRAAGSRDGRGLSSLGMAVGGLDLGADGQ